MEILGLLFVGWILWSVFSGGSDDAEARPNIGPFEFRLHDTHLDESDDSSPMIKEVQVQGLFPVDQVRKVGFVISVFDDTDGKYEPVLSVLEGFQEEESIVYQHSVEIGRIEPNQGFIKWVRVGVVIPELIQPPYSGRRKLVALVRMVDVNDMPSIHHGFMEKDELPKLIASKALSFYQNYDEKGYLEESENRDEAMSLTVKIAMAVAMADGSLDDSEGEIIKAWIVRAVEPYSDSKQSNLKAVLNTALKDSYDDASNGDLSLSRLTSRLNEIGEKKYKYEAVELCFDVMAADGVADEEELTVIRKVAESLDLDMSEVELMRDQKMVSLDSSVGGQASIEAILGIEPHWSDDKIKKHLRVEFQKWNNRLNTLEDGEERKNAQFMLEKVAEARKKYA